MFALLNVLLLLGVALARESKGHEYYSNLRHLQKSEKYVAPPQQHDHEYYANLKHLNHENGDGQVTKDHTYYSNLHHLDHEETHHEHYSNLHHINHGHAEDTSPQQEKNEMDNVHHPQHDHEYYAHLHHLKHEPETHEGKGHEYYSNLHHLSRSDKQQKGHNYYANLHHLHHGEKYVHGERDHEYYSHMHHLNRGHHHLHGCRDDYHHHGHRSHSFFWMMMPYRMLCSPDECVPASVKNSIMASWTETGRQVYQECNPNGQCDQQGMGKIVKCMFRTLMLNRTDITVQEYRATLRSWSTRSMANACENDITLKMMRCSRPQLHHLHRHGDESFERHHHHQHRCHKHAMRPQTTTPEVPSQEKPSERMASPPPAVDDVPEPEDDQEEVAYNSHHNARHHFQHVHDNSI